MPKHTYIRIYIYIVGNKSITVYIYIYIYLVLCDDYFGFVQWRHSQRMTQANLANSPHFWVTRRVWHTLSERSKSPDLVSWFCSNNNQMIFSLNFELFPEDVLSFFDCITFIECFTIISKFLLEFWTDFYVLFLSRASQERDMWSRYNHWNPSYGDCWGCWICQDTTWPPQLEHCLGSASEWGGQT